MTAPAISRFPVPSLKSMPDDIRERILAVQEKSGFVPNVFLVLAHRPDEFRAFFAYHDALMEKDGGLTKAEREMIVVATSSANQCHYCVVAHGAILRIRAKNPLVADQVAINYRKADITERQKAMLDFAMKVSLTAQAVTDADLAARQAARLYRRGRLGHRGDRRILRPVQPDGQRHQHAAERRILPDGPPAQAGLDPMFRVARRAARNDSPDAIEPCLAAMLSPSGPGADSVITSIMLGPAGTASMTKEQSKTTDDGDHVVIKFRPRTTAEAPKTRAEQLAPLRTPPQDLSQVRTKQRAGRLPPAHADEHRGRSVHRGADRLRRLAGHEHRRSAADPGLHPLRPARLRGHAPADEVAAKSSESLRIRLRTGPDRRAAAIELDAPLRYTTT